MFISLSLFLYVSVGGNQALVFVLCYGINAISIRAQHPHCPRYLAVTSCSNTSIQVSQRTPHSDSRTLSSTLQRRQHASDLFHLDTPDLVQVHFDCACSRNLYPAALGGGIFSCKFSHEIAFVRCSSAF